MTIVLEVLHWTATVVGALSWIGVGIWLGHGALHGEKRHTVYQATAVAVLWPYLVVAVLLQFVWYQINEALE